MAQKERTNIVNSLAKSYERMCRTFESMDVNAENYDEVECIMSEVESMYYKMGEFDILTRGAKEEA